MINLLWEIMWKFVPITQNAMKFISLENSQRARDDGDLKKGGWRWLKEGKIIGNPISIK